MFQLKLDRLSSHLADMYPFLNDIIDRSLTILNHRQFQYLVLDELCSKVTETRTKECKELHEFVKDGCAQLKMELRVDKLDLEDVLMQCEVHGYNDDHACQIHMNLNWYREILEVDPKNEEYVLHVVLGVVKLIHEVLHCCTNVFVQFSASVNPGKKSIKVTPTNIGRISKTRTTKSTKEIGDMGYGGEQILLGGRLFPMLENSINRKFKIVGLRLDVHEKSSISTSKYIVDRIFIDSLFNIDKLKTITDLDQLKIKLDIPFVCDQQTKVVRHARPKQSKLRRADSDSSLLSTSTSGSGSTSSDDLHNVDPNDPSVLYPPYYLPPPGFIPRTTDSTTSEDDDADFSVNGMPSNFRE